MTAPTGEKPLTSRLCTCREFRPEIAQTSTGAPVKGVEMVSKTLTFTHTQTQTYKHTQTVHACGDNVRAPL